MPMESLGFALRNAWLVPALPFLSFIVVGLFIRPLSKKAAGVVATAAIFAVRPGAKSSHANDHGTMAGCSPPGG